ncbi:MAG TPA: hypothetical protein VKE51_03405 [Vicinamibacterales bacterium]|nr:hypothetical protein [Vicinamibacterales bacterium]
MPVENLSADLLPLTWQLASAFGQGAGTMLLTTDAAKSVIDAYSEGLNRNREQSNTNALALIEFARALGAAAALISLQRGGAIIDVADVQTAIRNLKRTQAFPLVPCPVCIDAES